MSLPRYVLQRLLAAIPTLFLVVTLAFLLVRLAPGGPFDEERALPPDIEANIEAAYGLDRPLPEQFAIYVANLLRGDFGPSYRFRDHSVNELLAMALPYSLTLGTLAILLAATLGISAGSLAAMKRDSLLDRVVTGLSLTGISIPVFVVAPLLILLFAVHLNWLPAGFSGSTGAARYVLPVIALALPQIAYIARLTRAGLIDVLSSGFIRAARAQGIGTAALLRHHALKPALLPVLSYLGPAVAGILTGSVVIEEIFGIPGVGRYFVNGALNRDYTLVLAIVILYATLVIAMNLVVDILYGVVDPRVRRR
jgi:oligopeptide transport system permease protein